MFYDYEIAALVLFLSAYLIVSKLEQVGQLRENDEDVRDKKSEKAKDYSLPKFVKQGEPTYEQFKDDKDNYYTYNTRGKTTLIRRF